MEEFDGGGLMEATERLRRQGLKNGGGVCVRGLEKRTIGKIHNGNGKNGLDKWFKQKWVDIGSKRKDGSFRKMWSFKTKEGRETEVSKMRASCQSETDDRLAKGECRCQKKSSKINTGPKPTNVKTFAKRKKQQKNISVGIRGEYGGVSKILQRYVG